MEYSVGGNGDNVIKADNYKLNLYYNPSKRGEKICDIQHAVSEQSAELDIMIRTKEPVADREDTIKRFNLLDITFNDDDTIKSYGVNQKKLDTMLLTAGFFASKTIGVDFDPPDCLKSQLSNPLRVRFSRSLCILVWSCQIRDSQRVVPELPSLSTVYGLFHPLFCHSGHQYIHCLQVHRPPQVI